MVRVGLVLLFTLLMKSHSEIRCENQHGVEWPLYQRIQTLQFGLIQNENLNKYINFTEYSTNDDIVFNNDRTKIKRSYNTEQCIKDLKSIRKASSDEKSNWANESNLKFNVLI